LAGLADRALKHLGCDGWWPDRRLGLVTGEGLRPLFQLSAEQVEGLTRLWIGKE
jgi:hypothetical protein